jgi:hypothetical protein
MSEDDSKELQIDLEADLDKRFVFRTSSHSSRTGLLNGARELLENRIRERN